MIFITSIFIGLCMGCSAVFSMQYGAGDLKALRQSIYSSILLVGGTTLLLNAVSLIWLSPIIRLLQTPAEIVDLTYRYLFIILLGMIPLGIYNFYAFLLRAVGNSVVPLLFLAVSVVLTVISLGIRVALAYVLAAIPGIGYTGIWWAVPIGWALADIVGVAYYQRIRQRLYRTAL